MKKETFIAVFIGVGAGIAVAVFMIIQARHNQMLSTKSITTTLRITPAISKQVLQVQPLELSQPETGSITNTKSTTIKGKTVKGSTIVVQSPLKQLVLKNTAEDFSINDFPLALGENVIRVSVYSTDVTQPVQEKELKVYYLDEQ